MLRFLMKVETPVVVLVTAVLLVVAIIGCL